MQKLFYVLALIWLLILVYSDFVTGVRGAAALLIVLLAAAVFGLSERIAVAVRQIQDRSFDSKAENKRQWRFVAGISLLALGTLLVGTLGQGAWRCAQVSDSLSAECVWHGIVEKRTAKATDPNPLASKARTPNRPDSAS